MGARPIAILDSLRFGPLTEARNRYLFNGVVEGIGGYGNCLGVPTVGGEVAFDESYSGNPLVNAMCVGLARIDNLQKAIATGTGNLLMLVGADTGKDGIHGATFASVQLDDKSEERRPAVQVGNPFMEKLLMEACVELAEQHGDWIVGLQDLGAAGLTSASVECAAKGGVGIDIDVGAAPRREEGMTPYQLMLSESQERMLVIVKPEHEDDVRNLFERWELHCVVIGVVTDDGRATIRDSSASAGGDAAVARVPVELLTDPPQYVREGVKPSWLDDLNAYDMTALPDVTDANSALLGLLAEPEIASKRWVWRQYDHQVLTNTVIGPGSDATVIRIKGTDRAIALATDGDGRMCYLDPYAGGAMAVAEAARNVVCAGAEPIAITNCLNFGNPEKLEVYFQLEQAIRGMAAACRALGTPVVSGNVSLYNETATGDGTARPIYPTPVVGMLGLMENVDQVVPMAFQAEGDQVFLLGVDGLYGDAAALAGSEYLRTAHDLVAGQPRIDLELEVRLQKLCLEAGRAGLLKSAHDCSRGGLAVALAECCFPTGLGIGASGVPIEGRLDAALFGEAPSRIVVSTRNAASLQALAAEHEVPIFKLGTVSGDRLVVGDALDVAVAEMRDEYEAGLPRALGQSA
ncbi:MAG: phosphoribosylformylglycinamidine synthase subunit PurL, partial [Chloroflexi bacterium]|nr:phosphoribosylformylglycinamidine synthase subunit PurL [Chloroflexota bacterium]